MYFPLLRRLQLTLSSLVFPLYCPSCHREFTAGYGWICQDCWAALPASGTGLWYQDPELFDRTTVVYSYRNIMRDVIHQLKFNNRVDVANELGRRSAGRIEKQPDWTTLIPVPLHPVRIRERGYDQVLEIARSIAEVWELPLRTDLIRRRRNTVQQSVLSNDERLTNVAGAIQAVPNVRSLPQGTVVLVDDVIHTGGTVRACIDTLSSMGISDIHVLSAAG